MLGQLRLEYGTMETIIDCRLRGQTWIEVVPKLQDWVP